MRFTASHGFRFPGSLAQLLNNRKATQTLCSRDGLGHMISVAMPTVARHAEIHKLSELNRTENF